MTEIEQRLLILAEALERKSAEADGRSQALVDVAKAKNPARESERHEMRGLAHQGFHEYTRAAVYAEVAQAVRAALAPLPKDSP